MKIAIHNFGPLKEFLFDTSKDLHLIVGQNNVGKSYGVTLVYLILKSLLRADEVPSYAFVDEDDNTVIPSDLNEIEPKTDKEITATIESLATSYLSNYFLLLLNQSVGGTYEKRDLIQNYLTSDPFRICLTTPALVVTIKQEKGELLISKIECKKSIFARKIKQHRVRKELDDRTIIYIPENSSPDALRTSLRIAAATEASSFTAFALSEIRSVYFLPASRSGLYQALNAFGQIVAELSKSRAFISKKIELPGISEPLSDYFLRLSEINTTQSKDSKPLNDIASYIEDEILQGKVEFDNKTKRMTYQPKLSKVKLDLSATSSMVSELSPIVSYLRYVLPDDRASGGLSFYSTRRRRNKYPDAKALVVIEEPEAHLHPTVQLLLMKAFSRLLQNKVKVVITTHSNYLFNEISNLIIGKEIDSENVEAYQMKAYKDGSKTLALSVNADGIEDKNFSEVSEKLLNERLELLSENVSV